MRWYWKALIVVLAVAVYFNIGYASFRFVWNYSGNDIIMLFFANPPDRDIAADYLFFGALWPVMWLIILVAASVRFLWWLIFLGGLFKLAAAFFRWPDWPIIALIAVFCVVAMATGGPLSKGTRRRPENERLP